MDTTSLQLSVSLDAVVIPILSILAVILCIPPFIFHTIQRNFPAVCLVFWIVLNNFFNFVNAITWPTDDIENWWNGVGWCDIQVKLVIGSTLGIPGAVVSIMRRLARALDTENTVLVASKRQHRIDLIIDTLLCICLPTYGIITHYIIQPTRYYIFAISGCVQSFDNSWPSIVLYYIWPTITCLIAGYYCAIVVYRIKKYNTNFGSILEPAGSKLSKNRFLRLLGVSVVILCIFLPSEAFILHKNASFPLQTYSWAAIHGPEWETIIEEPSFGTVIFDRWIRIAAGFAIFLAFGLGAEATSAYRRWLLKFGFARIFPSLNRPRVPRQNFNSSTDTSGKESYASRAKLWARKVSVDSSPSRIILTFRKSMWKLRLSKFLDRQTREVLPRHTVITHGTASKSTPESSGNTFPTSPQWISWPILHSTPNLHYLAIEAEKSVASATYQNSIPIKDCPAKQVHIPSHPSLRTFIKNYQPLLSSSPFKSADQALQSVIQQPKPTLQHEEEQCPPQAYNALHAPSYNTPAQATDRHSPWKNNLYTKSLTEILPIPSQKQNIHRIAPPSRTIIPPPQDLTTCLSPSLPPTPILNNHRPETESRLPHHNFTL